MNRPAVAYAPVTPAATVGQEHHGAPPQADEAGTHLAPAEDLPDELAELTLTQLQVLHSRVCLQLDSEYLGSPDGAHPVTLDRHQELVAELATRRNRPAGPAHE
ncbi:hypothetical protein [Kocuria sabuli]|uniref:hypothetical protein n=1 Tax=Kocuria sabuli TaxID=3071448 RepID=UPI0034D4A1F0